MARSSSATRGAAPGPLRIPPTAAPGSGPDSTRSRSSTQFRNVAGIQVQQRPHVPAGASFDSPGSASRSRYIRTARSRNSWSYFLGADMVLNLLCWISTLRHFQGGSELSRLQGVWNRLNHWKRSEDLTLRSVELALATRTIGGYG